MLLYDVLVIFGFLSPFTNGNPNRKVEYTRNTARREKPPFLNDGVVLLRGMGRLLRITMHNPISQITFLLVEVTYEHSSTRRITP